MRGKKANPALEKKEEQMHKDLDGDGEQGESPGHTAKVLGSSEKEKGKKGTPPAFRNNVAGKGPKPTGSRQVLARTSGKSYKKTPGMGKMCGPCKKTGASFCSHM